MFSQEADTGAGLTAGPSEPEAEAEPEPSLEERLEAFQTDRLSFTPPPGEYVPDGQESCNEEEVAVYDGNLIKHKIEHSMLSITWSDDPTHDLQLKKMMASEILSKQEAIADSKQKAEENEKPKGESTTTWQFLHYVDDEARRGILWTVPQLLMKIEHASLNFSTGRLRCSVSGARGLYHYADR